MKSKNQTVFLIVIALLVAVSVGMTIFNMTVLSNEEVEYTQVWRVKKDIPANTQLESSMFGSQTVIKDAAAALPGMVYDLTSALSHIDPDTRETVPHYSSMPLGEGQYLTTSMYVTESNPENGQIYTIELVGTYVSDVAYSDAVDIYLLTPDNEVEELFMKKLIYRAKTTAIADAATTQTQTAAYEAASKLYIRVSYKEMVEYYTCLRDNRIIIVPYNAKFDPNYVPDNRAEEVVEEKELPEATWQYPAEEDMTFEEFAYEWDVDVEVLRGLNPDLTEIKAGDLVTLPYGN